MNLCPVQYVSVPAGLSLLLSPSAVCNLPPLSITASLFTGWMNPSALNPLLENASVCVCVSLYVFVSLARRWTSRLTDVRFITCACACVFTWHCNLGARRVCLRRRVSRCLRFLSHPDFFSPSFWRALDFFPFLVVFGRSAAARPWRRLSCHLSSAGSFRSHITASPLAAARCWLVRTTYWQPNKGISQQLSHMMNHVSLPPSPHILSATVICHISLVGYFICSFIKETAECGNGFYPPPHTDWTLAFDSATHVLIFKRLILVWTLSLAQKKTCGKLFLLFQYVFLLLKPVLNLEKGCLNTRLPLLGLG